jgi:pyrroloquinoline quinone biosynthesis protein E
VAKNCDLINNYCEAKNVRRTKMWVVVQKDNFHQLSDFVIFARKHGFKDLVFSLDMNFWGQSSWQLQNKKYEVSDEIDSQTCRSLVDLGYKSDIRVAFWFIGQKFNSNNKKTLCPWPWERAYISSDARIVPCCMVATPSVKDLGDASTFGDSWNDTDYQEFRQAHVNGEIPNFCMSCYESK